MKIQFITNFFIIFLYYYWIFIIIIIFARGISKTKGKKYNINLEIPHHKEDYIIIIYAQHFIHPLLSVISGKRKLL